MKSFFLFIATAPLKKILVLGTIFCVLGITSVRAQQEISESDIFQWFLEPNYSLTVKCSYSEITKYMAPYCHFHNEPENGMVTYYEEHRGNRHDCEKDSLFQAEEIYLLRLEKLNSAPIMRNPLSRETAKIVHNFELLTGTPNSEGVDSFGKYYISNIACTAWKIWLNKNKSRLCYCKRNGVLYANKSITNR